MNEGNEPLSEFPWAGAVADMQKLKEDVDKGFDYFWSRDQIVGFDKNGERIGTGIPRKYKKYNPRIFNYSSRSKAFPVSKHEESRKHTSG